MRTTDWLRTLNVICEDTRAWFILFIAALTACHPSSETNHLDGNSPVQLAAIALHGHQDLKQLDGLKSANTDEYVPWFVGLDTIMQWCVQASVELDTSRWQMSLNFNQHQPKGLELEFEPPVARKGSVMCYAVNFPERFEDGAHSVCAVLRDRKKIRRLPCHNFYYQHENAELQALIAQRSSLLTGRNEFDFIDSMIDLSDLANQTGFPMFATGAELIAAHFLEQRGDTNDLRRVSILLDTPRVWLKSSAAHGIAGQLHYQRAVTLLRKGKRNLAWSEIRLAEERYRKVAHSQTIVAVTRRAEILMHAGAVHEAQAKLSRSIRDCQNGTCDASLLRNAKNAVAWWLIQNPYISNDEATQAEQWLTEAMVGTRGLERSNILVNQAYLIALRGDDPDAVLEQIKLLLAGSKASARVDSLTRWSQFVQAMVFFHQQQDQRFLDITQVLGSAEQSDYLQARVHTLRGQYFRSQKLYSQAAFELELAVKVYKQLSEFNQRVVTNPGQRAEAYYELAGLAADQDNALLSWQWLDKLDEGFSSTECQMITSQWQTERATELSAQLAQLDTPASHVRKEQRASIRFQLKDELQALMRSQDACDSRPARVNPEGQFRAFLSSNEVILLRRESETTARIEKRTPIHRREFLGRINELNERMHTTYSHRSVSPGVLRSTARDLNWHDLTAPLAAALLPEESSVMLVTTPYILHGALQSIPLHALPYRNGWFSDTTTVVMSVNRAQPIPSRLNRKLSSSAFMFVVDPSRNLPDSSDAVKGYRALLPQATYLVKEQATTASVKRAMQLSRVWHFDSHARFDSVFPELSPLIFADGELTAGQLEPLGDDILLINLSGCQTGMWPITATQGKFGMAGALAQSKAQWVIASSVPLKNTMAIEFNRLFYKHFTLTQSVPNAYAYALNGLKDSFQPSHWASLLLVGHVEGANPSFTDSL